MSRPACTPVMIGTGTDVVVFQSGWKPPGNNKPIMGRVILHLGAETDDTGARVMQPAEIFFGGSQLIALRDALIAACVIYNDDGSVYEEPQA